MNIINSPYEVEITPREMQRELELTKNGGFVTYIDGSRKKGKVRTGIWGNKPQISLIIPLGSYTSVFDPEVMAILMSVQKLYVFKGKNITILIDSQIALRVLNKTGKL